MLISSFLQGLLARSFLMPRSGNRLVQGDMRDEKTCGRYVLETFYPAQYIMRKDLFLLFSALWM